MKIAFHTFGCKLNQVETEAAAAMFADSGYEIVKEGEADLYFINTCAVTARAEGKSRRMVRRLAREHPGKVIAAGCLAQLRREEIAPLEKLRLALGVGERFRVIELLNQSEGKVFVSPAPGGEILPLGGNRFRSRAFIKIQDGCDRECSYCIVPKLRGGSVSLGWEQVLGLARKAMSQQPREVVLTGVDIGSYRDASGLNLAGLLRKLEALPEVVRIRLSSVEPPGFTAELIEAIADSDKICRHFHLPLQSGSDRILERMGRGYDSAYYRGVVEKLGARFPGARIGADVIVGFPGEAEEDFERTLALVDESPVNHIHVFPFSPRPGTEYSPEDDIVPQSVKDERAEKLRRTVSAKYTDFLQRSLGGVETVFFEGDGSKGGFTDNYIRVIVPGAKVSGFHPVRLTEARLNQVIGELV